MEVTHGKCVLDRVHTSFYSPRIADTKHLSHTVFKRVSFFSRAASFKLPCMVPPLGVIQFKFQKLDSLCYCTALLALWHNNRQLTERHVTSRQHILLYNLSKKFHPSSFRYNLFDSKPTLIIHYLAETLATYFAT